MIRDHDDDDDIATCVGKALENYFQTLDGEKPAPFTRW
jgi:DNA-binding protein Fis